MSKNYFGLLDSRNTKYQGLVKDQKFNGIGILIDNLFNTIVSNWKGYILNGYTFIIFPFLQIFYGQMNQNKPIGICCFQINQKQKIVFISENTNKIIIAHVIAKQTITYFQKINNQYKIHKVYNYKSQNQQLNVLSQIFKINISLDQIEFSEFIKINIIAKHTQFQQLNIKNQGFFGFKNTQTLGIKLENNFPVQIGNYNKFPRKLVYGRKIFKNTYPKIRVQQGRFEEPSKTFTFPINKISIEAQKFNQQYFKLSTIFRNQFTKIQHIDKLYIEFKNLQKCIYAESTQKFGQETLQNGKKNQEVILKQYTLSEVKEEIYKAAQKKRGSYFRDKSPILSSQRSQKNHKYSYAQDSMYMDSSQSRKILSNNSINNSIIGSLSGRNDILGFNIGQVYKDNNGQENVIQQNENNNKNHYKDSYLLEKQPVNKKQQLIKSVYETIIAQKDYQRTVIHQILRSPQKQIYDRRIPNINQPQISSNKDSSSRKYRRYDISRSPLYNQKQQQKIYKILTKSPQRNYKYSQTGKRTYNNSSHNYLHSPYQKLRNSPYKQNQPTVRQFQTFHQKSHDNLAKYKAKKKQSNAQTYLNEVQLIKRNQAPMMQLKLFNYENNNKNPAYYRNEGQDQRSFNKNTRNFIDQIKIQDTVRDRSSNNKIKRTFNYVQQ